MNTSKRLKVAILDLYEGEPNQGMRCLRNILADFAKENNIKVDSNEFDVRVLNQVPDMSYDVYISSGGPGSPLESRYSDWEKKYFAWLNEVERWNMNPDNPQKKFVFFICHSFQLSARYYNIGILTKRHSSAFGIFPVHMLEDGFNEPVFAGLRDPFYAVDSRDYQVIQPNADVIRKMGAKILCIEKERRHVPYERAIMGIRYNEYMIGTQFHPEADASGMAMYLHRDDKKNAIIENYGEEKWRSMLGHLDDPDKILWTYSHVLPNFLNQAVEQLHGVLV
ncbi:MAG TPA: GMP synthase [Chitinophagaceae bacterium]|jgi:GMP synthase-like glutamine amidotransferase|nr:GMP synthase [Chitinophagaceae bacterium]